MGKNKETEVSFGDGRSKEPFNPAVEKRGT